MTVQPRDEITTRQAATLLGIGETMMRKLVSGCHVIVHRRGHTTLTSAVSGYSAFLRGSTSTSTSGQIAARAHLAKAAAVSASVERRRAKMQPSAEIIELMDQITMVAREKIVTLAVPGLPPGVASTLKNEAKAATREFAPILDQAKDILMGIREIDE